MLRTFTRRTIIKFRSQTHKRQIIRFTQSKENERKISKNIKEKDVSSYTPPK